MYIRCIGVNGKVPKQIPESLAPFVIEERGLTWYNPFLQHNRFCESSAFFHIWKNPELLNEYIGFFHYDMLINKIAIEFLEEQLGAIGTEKVLFTNVTLLAWRELNQVIAIQQWGEIVELYNTMFHTRHSIMDVLNEQMPLYHSFVVHRDIFQQQMSFVERAIPPLFEFIGYDTKHLPFMLERLHGLFLVLKKREGLRWIPLPGITHVDRLKDSWKGDA